MKSEIFLKQNSIRNLSKICT